MRVCVCGGGGGEPPTRRLKVSWEVGGEGGGRNGVPDANVTCEEGVAEGDS